MRHASSKNLSRKPIHWKEQDWVLTCNRQIYYRHKARQGIQTEYAGQHSLCCRSRCRSMFPSNASLYH